MRKVGHRKQDPVETGDTGVGQREVEEEGRDKLKWRKEKLKEKHPYNYTGQAKLCVWVYLYN